MTPMRKPESTPLLAEQERDEVLAEAAIRLARSNADRDALERSLLREKGHHMQAIQRIDFDLEQIARDREARKLNDAARRANDEVFQFDQFVPAPASQL